MIGIALRWRVLSASKAGRWAAGNEHGKAQQLIAGGLFPRGTYSAISQNSPSRVSKPHADQRGYKKIGQVVVAAGRTAEPGVEVPEAGA